MLLCMQQSYLLKKSDKTPQRVLQVAIQVGGFPPSGVNPTSLLSWYWPTRTSCATRGSDSKQSPDVNAMGDLSGAICSHIEKDKKLKLTDTPDTMVASTNTWIELNTAGAADQRFCN